MDYYNPGYNPNFWGPYPSLPFQNTLDQILTFILKPKIYAGTWKQGMTYQAGDIVLYGSNFYQLQNIVVNAQLTPLEDTASYVFYPALSGGGGGTSPSSFQKETVAITAGQTVVTVPFTYVPGTDSLAVFINGVAQASGYAETNSVTVTFDEPLPLGVVEFWGLASLVAGVANSANVSFQQSGTGAFLRTALSKLKETVTPEDFGAVGDGITNDTAAIQNWVSRGGNLVAGTPSVAYLITSEIVFPSNTAIKGTRGKSVFQWDSGARSCFVANSVDNVHIQGIQGKCLIDNSSPYALLKVRGCSNVSMTECDSENGFLFRSDSTSNTYAGVNDGNSSHKILVSRNGYEGTRLVGAQGAISIYYTRGATVTDNIINGAPGGIQFWGGDANPINDGILAAERKCTNLAISGNIITGCEAGIWGSMGRGVAIGVNCVSDCTDVGIDVEGTFNFSITGNSSEHCAAACYSTFYDCRDGVITGNTGRVTAFNAGTNYGIWFTGTALSNNTRGVIVSDNTLISELGATTIARLITNDAVLLMTDCSIIDNTLIDGQMQIRRQRSPVVTGNRIKWPTISINGTAILADGNTAHVIDDNVLVRSIPDTAPAANQSGIYLAYVDVANNNEQYSCSRNRINGWNGFSIYDEYAGVGRSYAAIVGNGISGGIARTGTGVFFQGLVSGNYTYSNPSVAVTATTY